MARSTKKGKYPTAKSKTNKVKEPLIEGLDVKELVIDPSSEENFILPKSQS